MKKDKNHRNNFVDALAMEMAYALLTKGSRIQILIQPSPKQLRKRGQRGWHLHSTLENQPNARQELYDVLQSVLLDLESPVNHRNGPEKKKRSKHVASQ